MHRQFSSHSLNHTVFDLKLTMNLNVKQHQSEYKKVIIKKEIKGRKTRRRGRVDADN